MKNKKVGLIVALSTLSVLGIVATSANFEFLTASALSRSEYASYNLILDSNNAPTVDVDNHTALFEVNGENVVYTNVSNEDGAHVKVLDGGSISKSNTSGLETVFATFTGGSLKVQTGYSSTNLEFEYALTSNELLNVKGNSFKIIADGDVVINSLAITYDCRTAAEADSVGLNSLKLVYNEDNTNAGKSIAKELQQAFKVKHGVELEVVGSEEPVTVNAVNLGFGTATTADTYTVAVNDTSIDLLADDKYGEYEAARYLLNNINRNDVFNSFATTTKTFESNENEFKIMSYNVRVANDGTLADGSAGDIKDRLPRIVKNITDKQPDSVGVQEASDTWRKGLKEALAPNYFYVGLGRESDRTGEASGIFYNVNTVKLIDSGTRWFSNTPTVPGSHFDDYGGYNRIYTYAILQRIADGKFYMHVNSHYDLTLNARMEDAAAQKAFTDLYIEKMPVFSTADFNCDKADEGDAVEWLINNGYKNSIDDIKNPTDINTFPVDGYVEDQTGGKTIDYILGCNKGMLFDDYEVLNYKVQAGEDTQPAPTSDHYPIYASGHFVEPLVSYADPYALPTANVAINNGYETLDGNMNFVSSISEYANRASIKAADTNSTTHGGVVSTDPYRGVQYVGSLNAAQGSSKNVNYNFISDAETTGDLVLVIASNNPSGNLNNNTNISANMTCDVNGSPVALDNIVLKCNDANEFVEWNQLVIKGVKILDGLNSVKLNGSLPNQYSLDVFADSEVSAIGEHEYSTDWEPSLEGHFHRCIDEGFEFLTTPVEKHTFDASTGLCSVCGAKPLAEIDLSANAVTLEEYDGKLTYVVNLIPNYNLDLIDIEKLFVVGDGNQGNFPCIHAVESTGDYAKFYFDLSGKYPTATSDSIYVAPHLYYNGLPFDGIAGDVRNHYKDTNWETRYYTTAQYDASPNHNEAAIYMTEEGHDLTVGKVRARIIYKWSMFMLSMSWTEGTVSPTISSTAKTATFFNLYAYKMTAIGTWERTGAAGTKPLLYIYFNYSGAIRPETLSLIDGSTKFPLAGFCNDGSKVYLCYDISSLPAGSKYSYFYAHLLRNGSAYNYAASNNDVKTSGSKSTSGTATSLSNGGSIKAVRANNNWYELFEAWSMLLIGSKIA